MKTVKNLKITLLITALSLTGVGIGFLFTSQVHAVTKTRYEKLELFNKVLYLIETQYYREVDTEKLIQGALKGMMDTLDPHSAFLDKEIFTRMQEDTQGEFGGLGIEVTQKDGVLVVVAPIDDSPAYKAGIKAGDKIVEFEHESIVGLPMEKAVDQLKGKPKSVVTIGIIRKGVRGIKQYSLTREIIKNHPVKAAIVGDNFIFLRLTQFQKDSGVYLLKGMSNLKAELAKKKKNVAGIILDLRSNPGGLLDEAVSVSSIFLKDGIVVSTEGRDAKEKDIKYVLKGGEKDLTTPLAVLINGSSASASEIVAGALQDSKRAVIMGARSFGKGSVQTVSRIDDEKGVKLTIAQYMTPSGRKIQAIGIKPDVDLLPIDGDQITQNDSDEDIIREKDLRNHLTATIESEQEKALRLEEEKKDRQKRMDTLTKKKVTKTETKEDKHEDEEEVRDSKRYEPANDYQVKQAINYLRSFDVYKSFNK